MKSVRVVVSGRVQGVGFRAWIEAEASARGLAGWVRNRRDGTVEAAFSGPEPVVASMLEAMGEGPSSALVGGIEVHAYYGDGMDDFQVLATV